MAESDGWRAEPSARQTGICHVFSAYGHAETRTFFDNLLPEGGARLSAVDGHGRQFDNNDNIAGLLSVLGGECPGAVMVVPEDAPPPKFPGDLSRDYGPLTDGEVERMLMDVSAGRMPGELERSSLPGVQAKLALARLDGDGRFLRPAMKGVPTTHLLKVAPRGDPKFHGTVANETLCMRVAETAGLPVADARRISFDRLDALLVRRYDRVVSADGLVTRLHQEDAAQALGLDRTLKYEAKARQANRGAGLADLIGPFAALTAVPEIRGAIGAAVDDDDVSAEEVRP